MDDNKKHSFDENSDKSPVLDLEQLLQHLLSIFTKDADGNVEPIIYGYTIFQKAGDKPNIQGFKIANAPFLEDEEEEIDDIYINKVNPVIEIYESDEHIYITNDFGVEEHEIEFNAKENRLEIGVLSSKFAYSREIELPSKVDPESATYTYKNGVFEIILKKDST